MMRSKSLRIKVSTMMIFDWNEFFQAFEDLWIISYKYLCVGIPKVVMF